ncbi:MAG: DUF3089 domain-containing protein [Ferruginibacter sp.]|nr:DUF3089 domain-containing protein [Ferruginibacter sp.]
MVASHSQGTLHARRLIAKFFEKKPSQKNLFGPVLLGFLFLKITLLLYPYFQVPFEPAVLLSGEDSNLATNRIM